MLSEKSNDMKIFLVGMPGSGKSSVGKLLADSLKVPFIDLDSVIEEEAGTAISEIFNTRGESYFRELERDSLHKIARGHENFVVATGGGAPCFFDNMDFMKQNGKVVFLDVPMIAIAQRLRNEGLAVRPLLKDFSTLETLEAHLSDTFSRRGKFYLKADVHVDADASAVEIVERIKEGL